MKPNLDLARTLPRLLAFYPVDGPVLTFILWCLLFVLSWPLALAALVLYPIVWIVLLPLRLIGVTVHGALALVGAVIMLPARALRAMA